MNFQDLLSNKVTISNKRASGGGKRGQNYSGLRFSVGYSKTSEDFNKNFNFSNDIWEELGFDNNGFFVSPDDPKNPTSIKLVVVPDTAEGDLEPKVFKKTSKSVGGKKSNKFKNDELERLLLAAGLIKEAGEGDVIENKPFNQVVGLEKVEMETPEGVSVYEVVPSTDNADDNEDDEPEVEEEGSDEEVSLEDDLGDI